MNRLLDGAKTLGFALLLPLAMVVALVDGLLTRPMKRDPRWVSNLIRRRLLGTQDRGEWDSFICLRIADVRLESVRRTCQTVEYEMGATEGPVYLSAAGMERLRAMLTELRGVEQADAADEVRDG